MSDGQKDKFSRRSFLETAGKSVIAAGALTAMAKQIRMCV